MPLAIEGSPYTLLLTQRLLTMPDAWQTTTITTIRWCLVEVGGTLIRHGRQLLLALAARVETARLSLKLRQRPYALSSAG